jgi:hypothetical protein
MKIHLFNNFHNGDLFLNQPVIRNLCINNPDISFELFCKYNSYIFTDIPNLTTQLSAPYPNNFLFKYINNEHIVINLWIAAFTINPEITGINSYEKLECNLEMYFTVFQKLLYYINTRYNIDIKFDNYSEDKYLPKIPDVDISDFLLWKNNRGNNNKLVFYYNYYPKSGQTISVDNHDSIIINLSKSFPNYTFIIPNSTPTIDDYINNNTLFKNIINCSQYFNCKEDITCENLCKNQKILEHCEYSIHFDIGACFYYVCDSSRTSKNISIHIGVKDYFFNNIHLASPTIKNKSRFILSNHAANTYLKLCDILNE